MSTYEQPETKTTTKVVAFTIANDTLNLKVARPTARTYETAPAKVDDVPTDYLAAINAWIAGGLQ